MNKYGLIGKNISYSFSRTYFAKKFDKENIPATYENFDLTDISEFPELIEHNHHLQGLNVTIPYKEKIIPFLDALDPVASQIGAVNTIKVGKDKSLTGFNTDYFGFAEAIKPHLKDYHKKALILGTGGASKAVAYALHSMGIDITFVSRNPNPGNLTYSELDDEVMTVNPIIIHCTPLGTSPRTTDYPPVPIEFINKKHLVFDLIYNPPVTKLMQLCKEQGATVLNGYKMLELQAEKAWDIWTSKKEPLQYKNL